MESITQPVRTDLCKSVNDNFLKCLALFQLNVPNRKSLLMLLYLLTDSNYRPSAATSYLQRLQKSASSSSNVTFSAATQAGGGAESSSDAESTRPQASVRELAKNFAGRCTTVVDAVHSPQKRIVGGAGHPLRKSFTSTSSLHSPSLENLIMGKPIIETHDHMDELVQDVIYAFMGAEGKYLKKDVRGFILDPKKSRSLSMTDAQMLLRLAELGYLHDQIIEFTNAESGSQPPGLFGQGLVTAIRHELTQYYGMVASLQEQVNRSMEVKESGLLNGNKGAGDRVTLMKLMLWSIQPLARFQCILTVATKCQYKKGGAIASVIFDFLSNGDPNVKLVTKELLRSVCVPLVHMLSRWLLEGVIEDPHGEFFIDSLAEINSDRLWHDKYRVREALLPNFISLEMARRILLIGKSINFMRVVCHDQSEIRDKRELELCLSANSDELFVPFEDTKLHAQIEKFCTTTSQKLLDIVLVQSHLMNHLHCIRKYLLLGQGDFVELLMENLKAELNRQAKDIQAYNLSAILDATVRQATTSGSCGSAEESYLNNLDVILLSQFEGDSGWDLFTLQYSVQGPLVTMLEPSMAKYKVIFKHLWRSKHIELVLTGKVWREQVCNAKIFRSMAGDMGALTRSLNLITSQMMHFIGQIQVYILFEVIECAWMQLAESIESAESIDDILESHHKFLEVIKSRIFLNEDSRKLSGTLETIYRQVTQLDAWQDKFFERCGRELEERHALEEEVVLSERLGQYGITQEEQFNRDHKQKLFQGELQGMQMKLKKIALTYESAVRQFLLLLAESNDLEMQTFGTRIDFNDYFKKNDSKLQEQGTFARQSSIYQAKKHAGQMGGSDGSPRQGPRFSKATKLGRY